MPLLLVSMSALLSSQTTPSGYGFYKNKRISIIGYSYFYGKIKIMISSDDFKKALTKSRL